MTGNAWGLHTPHISFRDAALGTESDDRRVDSRHACGRENSSEPGFTICQVNFVLLIACIVEHVTTHFILDSFTFRSLPFRSAHERVWSEDLAFTKFLREPRMFSGHLYEIRFIHS
jgi:hypothetical protein